MGRRTSALGRKEKHAKAREWSLCECGKYFNRERELGAHCGSTGHRPSGLLGKGQAARKRAQAWLQEGFAVARTAHAHPAWS